MPERGLCPCVRMYAALHSHHARLPNSSHTQTQAHLPTPSHPPTNSDAGAVMPL
jgi:hypothetical protein